MSCDRIPPPLTDEQKDQICAILAYGCDRETAAGVVECAIVDIGCAITDDSQFAIKVRRAEATAELRHMQNILNATKDGRYWRASVWWLERRSPERFGRRSADAITPKQLEQAVAAWNDLLRREFHAADDEQRVTDCIDKMYASIELLLDARSAATMLKCSSSPLQLEHASATDVDVPAASQAVPLTNSADP